MPASHQITPPFENGHGQDLSRLRLWLADRIQASMSDSGQLERSPKMVQMIHERFKLACKRTNIQLPPDREGAFLEELVNEIVGYGPIDTFLGDDSISEVMVNGPNLIFVERQGRLIETDARFVDDDHVQKIINKIVQPLGRQVNSASPMVDARLPNGSRVNAVVPPCAIDGPAITIRKFGKERLGIQDLVNYGSLTQEMADYLEACVASKLNIVVSGGTSSGKTTLLNVLSGFIPEHERIVTIEDSAELSLQQRHVVRLETKHPVHDGDSRVTIRQLVINSLRMRPERIVVGECRGGEALDMLQAMNTGHDGSLTTIHANSPRDTLSRLETLVLMAGMDLPLQVVRKQIASAVNIIVQIARLRDGSRKVTQITEIAGMEGDTVVMQDVFKFEDYGEEGGKVLGQFEPGGFRSVYDDRLKIHGFSLPVKMFMKKNGAGNGAMRLR